MNDFIRKNSENLIKDLSRFIDVPSVSGKEDEYGPYGKPVADAFNVLSDEAKALGLEVENLGYALRISIGKGDETFLVVAHGDVVPAGEGWTKPAYALTRENGMLYGRGVLDDKGAAVAAMYSLAAVKNSGKEPKMRVSLVVGGDEECGMSDMHRYVDEFGLPDYALTPDASFPVTNAELGFVFGKFSFDNVKENGNVKLISLKGGRAVNCVAEKCECKIEGSEEVFEYVKNISSELLEPETAFENGVISLLCRGLSAHGSVPEKGRSAVLDMLSVLERTFEKFGAENSFLSFTKKYVKGTEGEALGINCSDEFSGKLSVNFGMCSFENGKGEVSVDSRTPISADAFAISDKLKAVAEENGGEYIPDRNGNGIRIPEDSPFMRSVAASYEKATGKPCGFVCERGSTYAKAFCGKCVAFGPADEGNKAVCGNMHGPDEYISEEALISLSEVYAQVILDFCY
ncbi:MAG: M20 family metallopeptidase [Ruminococcaceae bacterium]|nr:M20 family metallopeptidase [Oscillospiraceae bacterium]